MDAILSTLQTARRQAKAKGGTVLDALVQITGRPAEEFDAQLRAHAGVAVATTAAEVCRESAAANHAGLRSIPCIPVRLTGDTEARFALGDPWDSEQVRRLSALIGRVPPLAAAPSALLAQGHEDAVSDGQAQNVRRDTDAATAPVVGLVDDALRSAFERGASDIHFECDRGSVVVKLRLDGVMTRLSSMAGAERAQEVISRIKVLAQLDITERRVPQDGRFRHAIAGRGDIDLRVSIMPSVFGEDAVLRLLDKAQLRSRSEAVSLDSLGFDKSSMDAIRELSELPHGMLLVTGPTGSGKTTTVYAVLSEVNTGLEKIITIEDPVEYELAGVLQIPVNERKGLTFAKGLRSILRHDPDRILVGEIRDPETAEIAVQSALTGHQVFTTVHANSVFDITGRFRHFGLDMFGFMSALNGVVVQRLVRTLCSACRGTRAPSEREIRWMESCGLTAAILPRATGCEDCGGTGFRGRTVLSEVHRVDDRLRDMVIGGAPVSALREHIHAVGPLPLRMLAARSVLAGVTTAEEIRRVVGWQ